jgi:hypothetical protein
MDARERLLDDADVAGILRVTRRRISSLVRRKEIPFIELPDGDIRFIESRIWEWVESRKPQPEGPAQ